MLLRQLDLSDAQRDQIRAIAESHRAEWEAHYLWPVSGLEALFSAWLARLFAWRIRRIWREDVELMTERRADGKPPPGCVPYRNPVLTDDLRAALKALEGLPAKSADPNVRTFELTVRP